MLKTMCLNQVYRPMCSAIPIDGKGNCQTCVPDERNKQCVGYIPIRTMVITKGGRDAVRVPQTR